MDSRINKNHLQYLLIYRFWFDELVSRRIRDHVILDSTDVVAHKVVTHCSMSDAK